jgi:hypothetical protein
MRCRSTLNTAWQALSEKNGKNLDHTILEVFSILSHLPHFSKLYDLQSAYFFIHFIQPLASLKFGAATSVSHTMFLD